MNSGGSANKEAQAPKDSKEKTTVSGNNAALQSKGGQSSRQSSQGASIGDMGRGGGMYQDETKLLAAVKLYSTLDDSGLKALELKNKYDSK